MSDRGHYTLSRFQGNGQRIVDKERRENMFDYRARRNSNPGPGSYRSPSDFGHYDGNVYGKTGAISYLTQGKSKGASGKFTKWLFFNNNYARKLNVLILFNKIIT